MTGSLLLLTLVCACPDFSADVARRADLMSADVETMPHVVREGLRQLSYDAAQQANAALRERECALMAKTQIDWSAIEKAIHEAAKETR